MLAPVGQCTTSSLMIPDSIFTIAVNLPSSVLRSQREQMAFLEMGGISAANTAHEAIDRNLSHIICAN